MGVVFPFFPSELADHGELGSSDRLGLSAEPGVAGSPAGTRGSRLRAARPGVSRSPRGPRGLPAPSSQHSGLRRPRRPTIPRLSSTRGLSGPRVPAAPKVPRGPQNYRSPQCPCSPVMSSRLPVSHDISTRRCRRPSPPATPPPWTRSPALVVLTRASP